MQFSKLSFAAVLALASSVLSQVVVTETHTVTVITVTVTPLSTSTSTVVVTVPGSVSTTSKKPSTITSTVTVTSSASPPPTTAVTSCPIPLYYQCGGTGWGGCTYCERTATCLSQNPFYYQCVEKTPTVVTLTSTVYGAMKPTAA